MSKTKRMKDGDQLVTRRQMTVLLSEWAKVADATITQKIAELKEELRAEFTVVVPPKEGTDAAL